MAKVVTEETRSKYWMLLVYGEKIEEVETKLNEWKVAKYVGVLHQADSVVDTDDADDDYCPQPHYHFVVGTGNQSRVKTVMRKLGLDMRFIRPCNNPKASFIYLVHETEDCKRLEKPLVSMESLFGSSGMLASAKETILKNRGYDSTDMGVLTLLDFIKNHSFDITPSSLLSYAVEYGLAKSYKAYASTLLREVDAHMKARSNLKTAPSTTEILISDTRELLRQDMELQFRDYAHANGLCVACGEYSLDSLINSNRKYHYYVSGTNI